MIQDLSEKIISMKEKEGELETKIHELTNKSEEHIKVFIS